jgi:GNAT superfamily N-acetyltransferase
MIELREARTDADLEDWIRVRRTLLPNESGGTVESLRAQEGPERLLLLAEVDGELAGGGLADRSDIRDRFFVMPRVLPEARRRRVGTALLGALAAHAERFDVRQVSTQLEEPGARGFAERFGFREIDRQVEQVKPLGDEPAPPPLPGLEVATIAERPELLRAAYPLACEGYADFALDGPATVSLDDWLREEATLPEGSVVALADGEIVGFSGLMRHDNDGVAEDGLTVVRRDRRGHGIAFALKRRELAWAAANGFREVVTWTQRGNDAMRRLNERLGYVHRNESATMLAPLPLP